VIFTSFFHSPEEISLCETVFKGDVLIETMKKWSAPPPKVLSGLNGGLHGLPSSFLSGKKIWDRSIPLS